MSAFDRLTERQPLLDGPARQHYVSRFYLKGFAQNRRVSVYDRTSGVVDALTPKNAAAIEHLYTFIDENDRRRFEIEALFGIVESRAGTALKSAVSRAPLSFEDREYLALFVAMHAIRTPAALAESRSVREKAEHARLKLIVSSERAAYKLIEESRPADTSEAELHRLATKLYEMVSGDHFRINVPDEAARAGALKTWDTVARTLFERDWTVVHAPSGSEYITSDSPVVLSPLSGTDHLPLGYGSLHTHVLFPLSRTAALVMNGDAGRMRHADVRPEQVERFNSAVAADCYRYVIGSNADLLRKTTAPLNLTGTRWAPRVDVGIGIPPGEELPAVFIKGLSKRPTVPILVRR
ncbi:MAG TPA: DUF4238 domain-containing protein [Piscinibacter sp.]|uniref:DUF4238 domain-containing protein n=1 Tax=Piscinibacter sp. TaxID=1903157 RepID=UPI002B6E9005|nr:DUF4238 domain-containing protein [Piscinibacter sp.]